MSNDLEATLLSAQILGIRVSIAAMEHVADLMTCSDKERAYVTQIITTGPALMIKGLVDSAGSHGVQLPKEMAPKDSMPYVAVQELAQTSLNALIGMKGPLIEQITQQMSSMETAFGAYAGAERMIVVLKEFFEAASRVQSKDVADALFERHLKLVH